VEPDLYPTAVFDEDFGGCKLLVHLETNSRFLAAFHISGGKVDDQGSVGVFPGILDGKLAYCRIEGYFPSLNTFVELCEIRDARVGG